MAAVFELQGFQAEVNTIAKTLLKKHACKSLRIHAEILSRAYVLRKYDGDERRCFHIQGVASSLHS